MSENAPYGPGDERDLDAGEYALGLGSAAERAEMRRRLANDPALAASIDAWHARLAPLYDAFEPVEAPETVWTGVLNSLGEADDVVVDLTRRLRRWRQAAIGASAIAASLLAILLVRPETPVPVAVTAPAPALLTASVGPEVGQPIAVVSYDSAGRRLVVSPVGIAVGGDQSPELWFIPEGGAPRSLGIIDPGAGTSVPLPADFDAAATLAITIEPKGGSPTGGPTSAPIGAGTLQRI